MNTTIGCQIPGASHPKEPVRLVDANSILRSIDVNGSAYDGSEYQAYKSGVEYVRSLIEDAPAIKPESMRHEKEWISVKDRLPAKHECVLIYDSVCHNIYMAWRDDDLDVWFSEEYLPDFVNVTYWMPLPVPPEVTQ
jgi:hypothetical protein